MDYDEEEAAETLEPGAVLGTYRIVRLLGEGGIGHVYLAEHVKLGRRVALKTLRKAFARNRHVVKRFFAEARAVNQISHDHIVQITDFVEDPTTGCFLIMELLEGKDLGATIESEGVLAPSRSLPILIQVSSALAAAHAAGIVHRDLKPDNIFLTTRSGRPDFVKLLDFGIAKLTQRDESHEQSMLRTAQGAVLGTPAYMSPEQACGHTVDHRTDIYALGIIAYEMLTGQLPIKGETFGEYVVNHSTVQPPAPSRLDTLRYAIHPELETLMLRCLEKEPAARPSSAAELETAFRSLLDRYGSTLDAAPQKKKKKARGKAPWIVGIAAIAGVLCALGVAAFVRPDIFGLGAERARTPRAERTEPRPTPLTPPPPAPPPVVLAPSEPSEAPPTRRAARAMVNVHFETTPPGAEVVRVGESAPLGVTPLDVDLARSEEPVTFELRLAGYQTARQELALTRDTRTVVTLTREPAQRRTPNSAERPTAQRTTPAERSARGNTHGHGPPPGRGPTKLNRSTVFDPFAN